MTSNSGNSQTSSTSAAALAEENRETVEYDAGGGDAKPQTKKDKEANKITVRTVDQSGRELHIKVNRTMDVGRLMKAYSARTNIDPQSLRFLANGEKLLKGNTFEHYALQDGDVIDVMLQQTGGEGGGCNGRQ